MSVLVITHAEDFKRVLAQPWLAKTPHFAVHHLPGGPAARAARPLSKGLSSAKVMLLDQPVDNSLENPVDKPVESAVGDTLKTAWAGYVVPKRHARRAVTRNLIRRQMRQALAEHSQPGFADPTSAEVRTDRLSGLPPGLWVLRLRQGFDRALFPSAASLPLRQAARDELQQLMGLALKRLRARGSAAVSPPKSPPPTPAGESASTP